MRREVSFEEISDGKRYGPEDLVRADTGGCRGCSACCKGMGRSIVLDPCDAFRLTCGLGVSFEKLLADGIELNVVDGVILPNLKMTGEAEACAFLGPDGRCRIHAFRPGICRIFPLGRLYEDGSFSYFLQVHECRMENRAKVKVKKWIDTPDYRRCDAFILRWHDFLSALQAELEAGADAKVISMTVLRVFYLTPYDKENDFYTQFAVRMQEAERLLFLGKESKQS